MNKYGKSHTHTQYLTIAIRANIATFLIITIFATGKQGTDFENMKGLELNVSTLVTQVVHHHFQIFRTTDVLGHDGEVVTIEQKLSE